MIEPADRGLPPALSRRRGLALLLGAGFAAAVLPAAGLRGARAASPGATPLLAPAWPYPEPPPAGADDDLVDVEGQAGFAKGTVLLLVGQVLDLAGAPLSEARVEIWQPDAAGHGPGGADRDPGFQGYGRVESDGRGAYRFRTVRPGTPDPARAPHIGIAVSGPGFTRLVTSVFLADDPRVAIDPGLAGLPGPERARLVAPVRPAPASSGDEGAVVARFDIVVPINGVLRG